MTEDRGQISDMGIWKARSQPPALWGLRPGGRSEVRGRLVARSVFIRY
jgi:hypothetical protein